MGQDRTVGPHGVAGFHLVAQLVNQVGPVVVQGELLFDARDVDA